MDDGVARLVGCDPRSIPLSATELLINAAGHDAMVRRISPFGDGHASRRICDLIADRLGLALPAAEMTA